MIAYTAWDSLQAIARHYDAALRLDPGTRLTLAPYWERSVCSAAARRLAERARRGLVMLQTASASRG